MLLTAKRTKQLPLILKKVSTNTIETQISLCKIKVKQRARTIFLRVSWLLKIIFRPRYVSQI